MADPKDSRGYRNRNPGNIDYNPNNKWQGQVGIEVSGNPPRFAVFETHEYGIRALAALLTTYQDRHGLRTIRGIIDRWAPPTENVTSAYVTQVAKNSGLTADQRLDLHTYAHMRPLVEAIIRHELGGQPYDDKTLDEGLRLAGLAKPVRTLAEAAATGTGSAAVTGIVTTSAVGVAVQTAPAIQALQGLDWRIGVALIVVVAIGVGVYLLNKRKTPGAAA